MDLGFEVLKLGQAPGWHFFSLEAGCTSLDTYRLCNFFSLARFIAVLPGSTSHLLLHSLTYRLMRPPCPTYLPAWLPAYLPRHPSTYHLPTSPSCCRHTDLPAYLLTYLPTYRPAHLRAKPAVDLCSCLLAYFLLALQLASLLAC